MEAALVLLAFVFMVYGGLSLGEDVADMAIAAHKGRLLRRLETTKNNNESINYKYTTEVKK